MARPRDLPVIDTLIGFRDLRQVGELKGARADWKRHPAEYMFKEIPDELTSAADRLDAIAETVSKMDGHNIRYGVIHLSDDRAEEALRRHPDRFIAIQPIDANKRMDAVRLVESAVRDHGARAISAFASGLVPVVPLNDRLWYPVYAKCVELDIPVFANVGVPGPRVPMMPQYVGHLDEVCYDFPDLKIVMRHGAEPWVDLAVKLLLKWPNLYYSTSAFAPKFWPEEIIRFANSRGSDKVIYGGYFPAGLELERIFAEMDEVPFRDHVWPKFLYDNAAKLLGIAPLAA
jgi:predicted TIM-barrel fold metal-dependent hydrolase